MTGKSVIGYIESMLFYQAYITGEVNNEFIFISSLLLMGKGSYKGYFYRNVYHLHSILRLLLLFPNIAL